MPHSMTAGSEAGTSASTSRVRMPTCTPCQVAVRVAVPPKTSREARPSSSVVTGSSRGPDDTRAPSTGRSPPSRHITFTVKISPMENWEEAMTGYWPQVPWPKWSRWETPERSTAHTVRVYRPASASS